MAEEEEEEDYMSDAFLEKCASASKDVRPSLLYRPGEKRRHELLKRQEEDNIRNKIAKKPLKVKEAEGREQGLKTEIGSDNKGFQLLSKMGYKPGMSIGKSEDAIKVPIPLELKMDRKGLGVKAAEKKKAEKYTKSVAKRQEELEKLTDPEQFRIRAQARAVQKEMEKDLRKAQSVCRNLDTQNDKTEPLESWYWPRVIQPKKLVDDDMEKYSNTVIDPEDGELDEEDVPEISEQLSIITDYLRTRYFYCIWCGTNYADSVDLADSCPGNSNDVH